MEKFVIDRSKWLNGTLREKTFNPKTDSSKISSTLLNEDIDRMCCLGQFLCPYVPDNLSMNYIPTPIGWVNTYTFDFESNEESELQKRLNLLVEIYAVDDESGPRYKHTLVAANLMEANDDKHLSDLDREIAVKKYFAQIGYDVEFIGEYEYERTLNLLVRYKDVKLWYN